MVKILPTYLHSQYISPPYYSSLVEVCLSQTLTLWREDLKVQVCITEWTGGGEGEKRQESYSVLLHGCFDKCSVWKGSESQVRMTEGCETMQTCGLILHSHPLPRYPTYCWARKFSRDRSQNPPFEHSCSRLDRADPLNKFSVTDNA